MERKGQKRFLIVLITLFLVGGFVATYVDAADTSKVASITASSGVKTNTRIPPSTSGSSSGANTVTDIFSSVFGTFNLADFYYGTTGKGGNQQIIDFILLTIFFIGIAQFSLAKIYLKGENPTNAGKAVIIAVGLALALAGTLGMNNYGLTLANFGPVALVILFSVIGFAVYQALVSLEINKIIAFAFAYLAMYFSVSSVTDLFRTSDMSVLIALLNLIKVGCIVIAIYGLIIMFMNGIRSLRGTPTTPDGQPAPRPEEPVAPLQNLEEARARERREAFEQRRERMIEGEASRLNELESRLNGIQLNDEVAQLRDLEELARIIRELGAIARNMENARTGRI